MAADYHCEKHAHYFEKMKRAPADIDFASYSKFKDRLIEYFKEHGYATDTRLMSLPSYAEGKRYMFYGKVHVDTFFDGLRMCHAFDWDGRLELESITAPLAEIVLGKLQIVEINVKDIKDLIILFLEHDVSDTDKESINGKHIAELLSKDWGFYHTATINLNKVKQLINEYISLPEQEAKAVKDRIHVLLDKIDKNPKSTRLQIKLSGDTA